MSAQSVISLVLVGGGLMVVVWLLHKVGRALASIAEAVVTLATLGVALWLLVKAVFVMVKAAVTHPRTSAVVVVLVGWLMCVCGWPPHWSARASWRPSHCSCGGGGTGPRSRRGQVRGCGRGGCGGRSTRGSCRAGCGPADLRSPILTDSRC
jgi:hypothetical protein